MAGTNLPSTSIPIIHTSGRSGFETLTRAYHPTRSTSSTYDNKSQGVSYPLIPPPPTYPALIYQPYETDNLGYPLLPAYTGTYGFVYPSFLQPSAGCNPQVAPAFNLPNAPHATHVFSGYTYPADTAPLPTEPASSTSSTFSQPTYWPVGNATLVAALPTFELSSSTYATIDPNRTAVVPSASYSSSHSSTLSSTHLSAPLTSTSTSLSFDEDDEGEDIGRYLRSPTSPPYSPAPIAPAPTATHFNISALDPPPSAATALPYPTLLPPPDTSVPRPTDDFILPLTLCPSPRYETVVAALPSQAPRLRGWKPQEERPIPPRTATTPVYGDMAAIFTPFIPGTYGMDRPSAASSSGREEEPNIGEPGVTRSDIMIPTLPEGVMQGFSLDLSRSRWGEEVEEDAEDDGSGEYREESRSLKRRRGQAEVTPGVEGGPSRRVSCLHPSRALS